MITEKQGSDIITKIILRTLDYDDLTAADRSYQGIREFFALDSTEDILLGFGYEIHLIITPYNRRITVNLVEGGTILYEIDSIQDRDNYKFSSYQKIG